MRIIEGEVHVKNIHTHTTHVIDGDKYSVYISWYLYLCVPRLVFFFSIIFFLVITFTFQPK